MSEETDDPWEVARRMLRAGRATWMDIQRHTGIPVERLKRALLPGFREMRNERAAESKRRRRAEREAGALPALPGERRRITPEEAEAVLRTVPMDTRSITGRMFGDPLPGRSALDRRGA